MKKLFIVFSILAAIAITIGIILVIIGGTFGFGNTNYSDEVFHSEQPVSNLELYVSAGSAKVELYDGDNVQIDFQTHSKYGFTVSEKDGTIKLEQHHKGWFLGWGIAMRTAPSATVKIPKGVALNLSVEIGAGAVTVEGGTFGNVECKVSAGELTLGNIECAKASCRVSAGALKVSSLKCGSLSCKVSAGSQNIGNVTCDNIDIAVSAGSLNMHVLGNKSDYSISVDKSAGSCNVTTQTGTDANKKIDIDISAGSVNVHFN